VRLHGLLGASGDSSCPQQLLQSHHDNVVERGVLGVERGVDQQRIRRGHRGGVEDRAVPGVPHHTADHRDAEGVAGDAGSEAALVAAAFVDLELVEVEMEGEVDVLQELLVLPLDSPSILEDVVSEALNST
jgi:hypothetical protein